MATNRRDFLTDDVLGVLLAPLATSGDYQVYSVYQLPEQLSGSKPTIMYGVTQEVVDNVGDDLEVQFGTTNLRVAIYCPGVTDTQLAGTNRKKINQIVAAVENAIGNVPESVYGNTFTDSYGNVVQVTKVTTDTVADDPDFGDPLSLQVIGGTIKWTGGVTVSQ